MPPTKVKTPFAVRKASMTELRKFEYPNPEKNAIFIAHIGPVDIGYISVDRRPGRVGSINDFFIQPKYQKSGAGTKLLAMGKSYLRSKGATQVMVWSDIEAIGFYEKKLNFPRPPIRSPAKQLLMGDLVKRQRTQCIGPQNALRPEARLRRRTR